MFGSAKLFGPYDSPSITDIAAPQNAWNSAASAIWTYIDGKYYQVPLNAQFANYSGCLHAYDGTNTYGQSVQGNTLNATYTFQYRVNWSNAISGETIPYKGTYYSRNYQIQCRVISRTEPGFGRILRYVGTTTSLPIYNTSQGSGWFNIASGSKGPSLNNNNFSVSFKDRISISVTGTFGQVHPVIWTQTITGNSTQTSSSGSGYNGRYDTKSGITRTFSIPDDFGLNYR